jgi:hypothetical protein
LKLKKIDYCGDLGENRDVILKRDFKVFGLTVKTGFSELKRSSVASVSHLEFIKCGISWLEDNYWLHECSGRMEFAFNLLPSKK